MRTVYLLRHAKSSWSDPALADHERPLASRGRRDAKRMASHLRELRVAPGLVLCSPAVRTRQTLELVRPGLGDSPEVEIEPRLYPGSCAELLDRLHAVPEEAEAVLLIGHNPALQDLAQRLASTGPGLAQLEAKFPTAALATLTIADAPWQRLSEGDAVLAGFVVPRQLR